MPKTTYRFGSSESSHVPVPDAWLPPEGAGIDPTFKLFVAAGARLVSDIAVPTLRVSDERLLQEPLLVPASDWRLDVMNPRIKEAIRNGEVPLTSAQERNVAAGVGVLMIAQSVSSVYRVGRPSPTGTRLAIPQAIREECAAVFQGDATDGNTAGPVAFAVRWPRQTGEYDGNSGNRWEPVSELDISVNWGDGAVYDTVGLKIARSGLEVDITRFADGFVDQPPMSTPALLQATAQAMMIAGIEARGAEVAAGA